MQKINKKQRPLLITILVAIVVLVLSLFFYNVFINDEISALSDQSLDQLMDNNVETFQLRIESSINLLESTASLLPVWDYLRYISRESGEYDYILNAFDYVMVINPYGYAVGSDSNVGDAFGEDYFQEAIAGETVISELIDTGYKDIMSIVISTPMVANGETRGVLADLIYVQTLDAMFGNPIDGITANLLVDGSGNIFSNGVEDSVFAHNSNVFDVIAGNDLKDEQEFELLKEDVSQNIGGERIVDFGGERSSIIYTPLGIEDWMIMTIIPENVILSTANNVTSVTFVVSFITVLIGFVFVFIINTSQRKHVKNVEELAYVSPLTKINTLIKFKLDAEGFIKKQGDKDLYLIKFDIENFRLVNESLGSDRGDEILKSMVAVTHHQYTGRSLYAHIHNDEFLALIAQNGLLVEQWCSKFIEELFGALGEDFKYNLQLVAGYYRIIDGDKADISACIEKVNIAHHNAKKDGVGISGYSDEYLAHAIKVKEIENAMDEALTNGEFKMVLQPGLSLGENKLIAAEALVRWISPRGNMMPDEFIPIFEKNGFILKLDMHMFEQACAYLKSWKQNGAELFTISVNFSRKHLYSTDFVSTLESICAKYEILPAYLGIEVTESSMLSNEGELISLIHQLQGKGFKVFMDDFGSGYSSLGLLKNTPVDVIKLDKSFFSRSESRQRSLAVVNSVIRLSKDLDIKTVAEGVETAEDVKVLKEMGCDIIQGYYYAKPMPVDEFKEFYHGSKSKLS